MHRAAAAEVVWQHRRGIFGEIQDYLPIPKTDLREGISSDDDERVFELIEMAKERWWEDT